jgi:HSP20 family molecular chaperone IbpA
MPGIERGKLSLFADSGSLSITSKGRRAYNTTIDLPSQVDPRGAHAFYNNGVLQVELTKSRSYEGKGIKIEMS